MSCEEYEQGKVLLPADAAATVHAALIDTANAIRQAALDAIEKLPGYYAAGMDWRAREEAVRTWRRDTEAANGGTLCWITLDRLQTALEREEDPAATVDRLLPAATTETRKFEAGFTTIIIKGRNLSWSAEGNRVHDDLPEHPLYNVLHDQLDALDWPEGTGGASWRTDEYELASYGDEDGWTEQRAWGDEATSSTTI